MKGLFFSLDAITAFIIIVFILSFSFAFFANTLSIQKKSHSSFSTQADLIRVSELMVSSSDKGLVKYENNEVKHHEVKEENFNLKKVFMFDGKKYGVEVMGLKSSGFFEGDGVSRIALCGSDLCVIKVTRI